MQAELSRLGVCIVEYDGTFLCPLLCCVHPLWHPVSLKPCSMALCWSKGQGTAGHVAQSVECLPSVHEALGTISNKVWTDYGGAHLQSQHSRGREQRKGGHGRSILLKRGTWAHCLCHCARHHVRISLATVPEVGQLNHRLDLFLVFFFPHGICTSLHSCKKKKKKV